MGHPMSENKYNDNLPQPPKPEDFESEDEYLEAKGYYGSHVGRIRKMVEQARAHQAERMKAASQDGAAPEIAPETTQRSSGPQNGISMDSPEYRDHHSAAVAKWLANKPPKAEPENTEESLQEWLEKLPPGTKLKVTLPPK